MMSGAARGMASAHSNSMKMRKKVSLNMNNSLVQGDAISLYSLAYLQFIKSK